MTLEDVLQELESQKQNLFTTKDSLPEAIEQINQMFPREERHVVTTALFIYHNTLLNELQKRLKEQAK